MLLALELIPVRTGSMKCHISTVTLNIFHSTWFFYFLKSLVCTGEEGFPCLFFICSSCLCEDLACSAHFACLPLPDKAAAISVGTTQKTHFQECCYHSSTPQLPVEDTCRSSFTRWKDPSLASTRTSSPPRFNMKEWEENKFDHHQMITLKWRDQVLAFAFTPRWLWDAKLQLNPVKLQQLSHSPI